MSSFTVSYNHLFPKMHKRQFCYESLAVASSSQIRADGSASVAASTRFLAYPDACGGGSAVAVLPLTSYGRRHVPTTARTYQQPLLKLHSSKVHCVGFAPHDRARTVLASGASDGSLHVFRVPEEGLVEDITSADSDAVTCKTGAAVHGVRFHPTAGSIALLTHPKTADVWDCTTQQRVVKTSATDHMQDVYSAAWSFDGSRFVTTCKDKIVRLFDPRTGDCEATTMGHGSWRPSIAVWLNRDQTFLTTGHGSDMSREVLVWDARALSKHVAKKRVDSGSSVLMPLADTDTGLVYLTSRGDTGLRIWHYKTDAKSNPLKEIINSRISGDPVLDACLLPKAACDIKGCEMARVLRLTQKSIDPVRVELPRRDKSKIDQNVFVDTCARQSEPPMTAAEFVTGNKTIPSPPVVSVVDAVATVKSSGGGVEGSKKMTHAASSGNMGGESKRSHGGGDASDLQASAEDQAAAVEDAQAASRRKRAAAAFGIQSKFKYIRLEAPGERNVEKTWFNLKVNTSASDAMPIAASATRFALPWQSVGGGPIFVGSIALPGKAPSGNAVPLLSGHKERVMSLQFNPFDSQVMASGSDDADIRLWRFDGAGVNTAQVQSVMGGHLRGVRSLLWHPVANNVLASASSDNTVRIWNCDESGKDSVDAAVTAVFDEPPISMSWSTNGSSLAVAGRRTVFVVDPRTSGENKQAMLENTHAGAKGQRVVWLKDTNIIFTAGSTKTAGREFKLWDVRKAVKAVTTVPIDRGASVFNPFYDEDTDMMYLAAKGELSIHCYDLSDPGKVLECDRLAVPGKPMCGLCFLPKASCNVMDKQVVTALHCSSTAVQPISFKVPRAAKLNKYFHDDLFPPTRDFSAVQMTAASFFDKAIAMPEPARVSPRPDSMPLLSEKPKDIVRTSSGSKASTLMMAERAEAARIKAKEASFNRLGALANQYAKYNTNKSMGSRKIKGERERVAERKKESEEDSEDSGWTDSDEDE